MSVKVGIFTDEQRFKYLFVFILIFMKPILCFSYCDHIIIFLPQAHAADSMTGIQSSPDLDLNILNSRVADSQFKIANFIERKYPNVPIFTEQAGPHDVNLNGLEKDKKEALKNHYLEIYPNGLPEKSQKLTDAQKQNLINNGGELVQLFRSKVNEIHRVLEDKNESDSIFNPIQKWFKVNKGNTSYPPEIAKLVYGERENAALRQVNKFFQSHPDKLFAILIFGANHNFSFYPEQFDSNCISIPSEFQDDWAGRYRTGPEGFYENTLQKRKFNSEYSIK